MKGAVSRVFKRREAPLRFLDLTWLICLVGDFRAPDSIEYGPFAFRRG